jgi:platelet-activating factor acetylhydrolase
MPAHANARLLAAPAEGGRWPVLVFSHGLGGSRNGYSQLLGSLASHGLVVVVPEHRDGSCPVSFVRDGPDGERQPVPYRSISHTPGREVEEARTEQLRIRLWELGVVIEGLLAIDQGVDARWIVGGTGPKAEASHSLAMFKDGLDIHRPGSIAWAGHSFGAATVIQLVKSVFYRASPRPGTVVPLYSPSDSAAIVAQIHPSSPIGLFDLWAYPLKFELSRWLWEKPLPTYAGDGPDGSNVAAILSEAFFKWKANLAATKQAISAHSANGRPDAGRSQAHLFYPAGSAHLSQSDFGILFPRLVRIAFNAKEPERTLRLNVRAMLEVLRRGGMRLADTSDVDMELAEAASDAGDQGGSGSVPGQQDGAILLKHGAVRGWIPLSLGQDEGSAAPLDERAGAELADGSPRQAVGDGELLTGTR